MAAAAPSVPGSARAPALEPLTATEAAAPVFEVQSLSKTYRMGEVEVQALRDVSLGAARAASSSSCSGRPGPANRRCSTSWAASTCRRRGTVRYRDHDLTQADDAG